MNYCARNIFICLAQDARGRVWAFEVGEHSEVGALESLSPQKNKGVRKGSFIFLSAGGIFVRTRN